MSIIKKIKNIKNENEELKKEIEHLSYNLDVVNNNFYYLHNKLQEERSNKNYNKMVVEESKEETKFDFISDDTL